MIGVFPDPSPDELLYSVLARYLDLVRYPSRKKAIAELFGSDTSIAVFDLPSHIDHLVASLPPGHAYSADQLIDNNTLLPFYGPFLAKDQLRAVRRDMRRAGGPAVHRRSGIMSRPFSQDSMLQ